MTLLWSIIEHINRNLHKSCILFEFQIHLRQSQARQTKPFSAVAHPVLFMTTIILWNWIDSQSSSSSFGPLQFVNIITLKSCYCPTSISYSHSAKISKRWIHSFFPSFQKTFLISYIFSFNYYFLVQKKSQPALRDLAKPSMNRTSDHHSRVSNQDVYPICIPQISS